MSGIATLIVAAASTLQGSGDSYAIGNSRVVAHFLCSGENDDVQIQAAIDALPGNGGRVVLTEGTYTISALLNLTDKVTLEGQGRSTILKTDGTQGHLLRLQSLEEVTVRDIHFDCNFVTGGIGMTLDGSLRCRFYNLSFNGCISAGLRLLVDGATQNCGLNRFYNTTIRQSRVGIIFNGNLSPLRPVTLNSFFGLEITGQTGFTSTGINFVDSADNNLFHDVRIEFTTDGSTGVIYNSASAGDTGQEVYENHFYGLIIKGSGSSDKSIDGNATRATFPSLIYGLRTTRTDATPDLQDDSQISIVTGNIGGTVIDGLIPDPGNGDAIPAAYSGHVPLVTAGAETRTLADALGAGLTLDLYLKTDGGDCVVTTASPVNQTGNNTLTFADVGDHIRLASIEDGSDFEWRVVANDGVALTTV